MRRVLAATAVVACVALAVTGGSAVATAGRLSGHKHAVSPKAQDHKMLAVAPVPKSAVSGLTAHERRRLRAASVWPRDYVVRDLFWTVPESTEALQDRWTAMTPHGMDPQSGSAGEGPGNALTADWIAKPMPTNLLDADLTMVAIPIDAHHSMVMAQAASEPALPISAFRVPSTVRRLVVSRWSAAPSQELERRVVKGKDAHRLTGLVDALRPYPKNPGFTCPGGAPHHLIVARDHRHTWRFDIATCAPAIEVSRDASPARSFHNSRSLDKLVRRELSAS